MSQSQTISIPTNGGAFDAYLARPAQAGPAPGVVVIQEIFGVNSNIKGVADWLAGEGYCALALDLFWRLERNVSITDPDDAELEKAFGLMTAFDQDAGVGDIQAAIDFLRADKDLCTGKVGTLGFCLGGKMAYLSATGTDADANIGYYGVGIQDMLDEAKKFPPRWFCRWRAKTNLCPPRRRPPFMPDSTRMPKCRSSTIPNRITASRARVACILTPPRPRQPTRAPWRHWPARCAKTRFGRKFSPRV